MSKKIKVFTHDDLDGIGCALLFTKVYGEEMLDITFCSVYELESELRIYFLGKKYENNIHTFITDLSVKDSSILSTINKFKELNERVTLIDHHATSLNLNKYDWCDVKIKHENGKLASATSLVHEYLSELHADKLANITDLVELIRSYDTWDWTRDNVPLAYELNTLFYIMGKEDFMEEYLNFTNASAPISTQNRKLLNRESSKIDKYISDTVDYVQTLQVAEFKVGICFAEQYINELAHHIYTNFDVDFAMIVDMRKQRISFRSNNDVKMLDLAELRGGGGHKNSCGSPLPSGLVNQVLELIAKG